MKRREVRERRSRTIFSILQEGEHNEAVMKKIEQATANVDDREKVLKMRKKCFAQKETKSVQIYRSLKIRS